MLANPKLHGTRRATIPYPDEYDFHTHDKHPARDHCGFLALIALRPLITSHSVHAQSSSAMQICIGALSAVAPQACLDSGGPSCVPTQQPAGLVLFDQATGNVWGYPMYTVSLTAAGVSWAPTFGPPTLYGTFNAPGQPMSPPPSQP